MLQVIRAISGGLALVAFFLFLMPDAVHAGSPADEQLTWLQTVLPDADSFSDEEGDPPVFRGYRIDPVTQRQTLVGYAFLTSDVPPPIRGYSGEIEALVGMDLHGTITGVKVLSYREAIMRIIGDFFGRPGFQEQYSGKSVSDPFRVGEDVDGITRATISVRALSRGVRDSARLVAIAYLQKPKLETLRNRSATPGASGLESIERLKWWGLISRGVVGRLVIGSNGLPSLDLTFTYIFNDAMGVLLLGQNQYAEVRRAAGDRILDSSLLLVGIGGPLAGTFRLEALTVEQGAGIRGVSQGDLIYTGKPMGGRIAGMASLINVVLVDGAVNFNQPVRFLYDQRPAMDIYSVDYEIPTDLKWLAPEWAPLPQESVSLTTSSDPTFALSFTDVEEDSALSGLITGVSWTGVGALLFLFCLTVYAFLRKSARLRWIALIYSVIYLGFVDGPFLSISHVIGGIEFGPSWYLNNLRMLLVVGFAVLTSLLWGRFLCGFLCPFGALQDFLVRSIPRRFRRELPQRFHDGALYIKYGLLGMILVLALLQSDAIIFHYFEPFGTVFFMSGSVLLWGILIAILLASAIVSRFYCRYLCPLGAALGLVSFLALFRIKRVSQCAACTLCEQDCPTGAIRGPDIDFKECVRCNNCDINLLARTGVCQHNWEDVRVRLKNYVPTPL